MKKAEREEVRELEGLDADERRQELMEFLGGEKSDESDEESEAEDGPQEPTEDMSDEQKIQLLKRQAPLLFPLIEEFKIYNTELKNTLEPLSKLLRGADERLQKYVRNRTQVIRSYLLNIAFYLRLRAKASPTLESHPVVDRLTRLRRIIEKISSEKSQDYLEVYLEAARENDTKNMKKLKQKEKIENKKSESIEIEEEVENENDQNEEDEDGKRGITYKMDKNKGLKAKGQRKRRNPRVKNRMAYESAVKRRKGAVRSVITDQKKPYTGEASGIRAGIKKSVRIKS